MLYGKDRKDHREIFYAVWKKQQTNEPLDMFEKQIMSIVMKHPEYHFIFNNTEKYVEQDFFEEQGETNPFLHFSLHTALLEQITTNRPVGIKTLFEDAIKTFGDIHEAEHCLMNSIAFELHEIQQNKKQFDEKRYLKRIKKAIRQGYW